MNLFKLAIKEKQPTPPGSEVPLSPARAALVRQLDLIADLQGKIDEAGRPLAALQSVRIAAARAQAALDSVLADEAESMRRWAEDGAIGAAPSAKPGSDKIVKAAAEAAAQLRAAEAAAPKFQAIKDPIEADRQRAVAALPALRLSVIEEEACALNVRRLDLLLQLADVVAEMRGARALLAAHHEFGDSATARLGAKVHEALNTDAVIDGDAKVLAANARWRALLAKLEQDPRAAL